LDAYRLPSVVIAPHLVPKRPLCDAPFELLVDRALFFAHPVSLRFPHATTAADLDKLANGSTILTNNNKSNANNNNNSNNHNNNDDDTSSTNSNTATARSTHSKESLPAEGSASGSTGTTSSTRQSPLTAETTTTTTSDGSTHSIDPVLGHTAAAAERELRAPQSNSELSSHSEGERARKQVSADAANHPADESQPTEEREQEEQDRVLYVSVVLACPLGDGLSAERRGALQAACRLVSLALQGEQDRVGLVSQEASRVQEVRDAWLRTQREEEDVRRRPDHAALTRALLAVSPLCRALRRLYTALLRRRPAVLLRLAPHRVLCVPLRAAVACPRSSPSTAANVLPHHALLLLPSPHDPDAPQQQQQQQQRALLTNDAPLLSLPPGSSDELVQLASRARLNRSLGQLAVELDLSWERTRTLAAHLQHWGVAEVCPRLQASQVITLNRRQRGPPSLSLYRRFSRHFPAFAARLSLPALLNRFAQPFTVKQHLDSLDANASNTVLRRCFAAVVQWLLQCEVLTALEPRPYYLPDLPHYAPNAPDLPTGAAAERQRALDALAHSEHDHRSAALREDFCVLAPHLDASTSVAEVAHHRSTAAAARHSVYTLLEQFPDHARACLH